MKILSVKLLNINSLKGEHEIRFDQPPFSDCGLFAITGPTGSGKTTILDAITVALYGEVHRHKGDVKEIMSRHTGQCYAEVEFEVKDIAYRAKWSVAKARNKHDGRFQSEKMELSEVATGAMLGNHRLTDTKKAIVELCGLDYSQFLRSVILSQGDFTKFLKAGDNERSELLEKITDTGIYTEISKFVFEKQRTEKEVLDSLKSVLQGMEVLPQSEIDLMDARLLELGKEAVALKEDRSKFSGHLQWILDLDILKQKLEKGTLSLEEKRRAFEENRPQFEKLAQHQKALPFKPDLVGIASVQELIDANQQRIVELKNQLPVFTEEVNTATTLFEKAKLDLTQAKSKQTTIAPLIEQVILLDAEIVGLHSRVGTAKAHAEQSLMEVEQLKDASQKKAEAIAELEGESNALQTWLEHNDLDKDLDKQQIIFRQLHSNYQQAEAQALLAQKESVNAQRLMDEAVAEIEIKKGLIAALDAELHKNRNHSEALLVKLDELKFTDAEGVEATINSLPEQIKHYEIQHIYALDYHRDQQQVDFLRDAITGLTGSAKALAAEVKQLTTDKAEGETHFKNLQEAVDLEKRIQNYEEARLTLEPEKPCPLCGSLEHPYVEAGHISRHSAYELRRDEMELRLRAITENLNKSLRDQERIKADLSNKQEQVLKVNAEQSARLQKFEELNQLLSQKTQITEPETIAALRAKKQKDLAQLLETTALVRRLKLEIDAVSARMASQREAIMKESNNVSLTQQKVETMRVDLNRTSLVFAEARANQIKLEGEISALLQVYGINLKETELPLVSALLSARYEHYQRSVENFKQLDLKVIHARNESLALIDKLKDRTANASKAGVAYQAELDTYQQRKAHRSTLFEDKDPIVIRELYEKNCHEAETLKDSRNVQLQEKLNRLNKTSAQLQTAEPELEEMRLKIQKLKDALLEKLDRVQILGIADLEQQFLPDHVFQDLSMLEKRLTEELMGLKRLIQSTEEEIKTHIDKNLTAESREDLSNKLTELDQAINTLNQEIGGINSRLVQNDNLKRRFQDQLVQIEVQKAVFAKWEKLCNLIGAADGKKFRRFAQGLTLARLSELANMHLVKLSDRYQIMKGSNDTLELLIIDGYQADVVRPMATLSGGESFLVSLALALGLSDLASRKVQINSLFIDEGFGTLDADTLDQAISALENLQARGKTIGIISHVEALKDRISTQIQLKKHTGGSSEIKVVSYMKQSETLWGNLV